MYRYDYYTISLPSDLGDNLPDVAINEARERARLWCVPCEWTARLIEAGEWETVYRVRRKRHKTN